MVLTETGLAKVFQRVKSFVASQLNSKASAIHTHTSSDITDLPSGLTVDTTLDGASSNAIANSAVSSALDGKASSSHTHVASDITNLSENWTVTGENLNISFGTSGSTWVYDANTKHLTIS